MSIIPLHCIQEPEYKKAHERYALHKKIRSSECQLSEQIKEMEARFENYEEENKLPSSREKKQLRALIKEAETTVIHKGGYQIVFCTCSEAGSARVVDNIKPTHLIIDEAAMITEPEAMIPIQLADHVTLIGDHQQLQPVINYKHAKERGLGCSLFERYAQSNKDSHDAICKFPSEQFYDGQLITDQSVSQQFCSLEGFWPNGPNCPIAFCDVEGKEEDGSIDHKVYRESKRNRIEADKTAEIIVALRKKITQNNINNPLRIAVLTPYKAQKKLMEEIVKEKNLNVDSVLTITESQGCEFEFVILSTVRSIPRTKLKNRAAVQPDRTWIGEHLGSLTDRHQICVGITRAKYGLVIVGNAELLKYNETWEKLLKHYEERGCKEEVKDFLTRNNN
ncbi:uncharacterized protein [Dysidea avara]|uniref:uncharacterized protein n=1 Tax=Dysidea avara TaxID=196820 RepID=UPI00332C2FB6